MEDNKKILITKRQKLINSLRRLKEIKRIEDKELDYIVRGLTKKGKDPKNNVK